MAMILALWLPVLLAAVLVFLASSAIHMFLGYHASDFGPVPDEERLMEALRAADVRPGEYVLPHAPDMATMGSPEFVERATRGPVAFLTVLVSGPPSMGKQLVQWFAYILVVSVLTAYVAGLAVGPGAAYMDVFRIVSSTAFVAYAVALWQSSIWYGRAWSTTLKNTLDGLVYALLTAGAFAWLWPA